jgi:hypothetical protein
MPDWLHDSFPHGLSVPWQTVLSRLVAGSLFGGAVATIYYSTHRRDDSYQPTFVSTLVLLTILIALVTQLIGESIAKAFSLVGALSIVRFRTLVPDTRDTAFVVFAVVMGMAVGGGHLPVALAGLAVTGIAAFVVRPRGTNGTGLLFDWALTVRVGIHQNPRAVEDVFAEHAENHQTIGTSTSRQGASLDLMYHVRLKSSSTPAALVGELNQLEGVQSVELVRR